MNKLLLSTALAVGVLMTASLAHAAGAILWSDNPQAGFAYDKDADRYFKTIDVDPTLAKNMGKWKMRIERRNTAAAGFVYEKDENAYLKTTILRHDPLVDGPNFCTHIVWSENPQAGYAYDKDADAYFKVSILTIEEAKDQGRL